MTETAFPSEELGYFYDTIHGRFALEELPEQFRPALKAALSSKTLARLKGISQLGHTSVSFFSATHTRFSHAVGTMLVMDKLFRRVVDKGLPSNIFEEIAHHYSVDKRFGSARNMLHCHLLLVALYQDAGELPFQKVTSLYFRPALGLRGADSQGWTGKQIFGVRALLRDMEGSSAFAGYDRDFLTYLLTGRGGDIGVSALPAVLQMVDGYAIDADRLDYVYRDSLATIGSLSRPSTVLESIVRYEPERVIVNDPRPVTDFLSTRMRLFTFVYNSADVRFRQALLRTILEGYWDGEKAQSAFEAADLSPELTYKNFMELDDNSLLRKLSALEDGHLQSYRQHAREVLLRAIPEYEYRILKQPSPAAATSEPKRLPPELFFDLLADHGHHQLYRSGSVCIEQRLTAKVETVIPLEQGAGAFSRLFAEGTSPMLVPGGFYLFLPHGWRDKGKDWQDVGESIRSGGVFQRVQWEDAWRGLSDLPKDTRAMTDRGFTGRAISISFCKEDFPTVVSIVRELFLRKRRYCLFLDHLQLQGSGGTVEANSQRLIEDAEAVLVVCSIQYLRKYSEGGCVGIEIRAMNRRNNAIPIVPLGVDERHELDQVDGWKWEFMNEAWRNEKLVLSNPAPLREGRAEIVCKAVEAALSKIGA